jgi:hypothetical protein
MNPACARATECSYRLRRASLGCGAVQSTDMRHDRLGDMSLILPSRRVGEGCIDGHDHDPDVSLGLPLISRRKKMTMVSGPLESVVGQCRSAGSAVFHVVVTMAIVMEMALVKIGIRPAHCRVSDSFDVLSMGHLNTPGQFRSHTSRSNIRPDLATRFASHMWHCHECR